MVLREAARAVGSALCERAENNTSKGQGRTALFLERTANAPPAALRYTANNATHTQHCSPRDTTYFRLMVECYNFLKNLRSAPLRAASSKRRLRHLLSSRFIFVIYLAFLLSHLPRVLLRRGEWVVDIETR